ncbi:hypothetical protein KV557_00105 [Kitasatospora aureofaciens]|uniref:hypothetical protein n=1 Tax=Kitasatospora aureofaciens TaxID=1894 RepID=UPI001C486861|nr:hypothetical protein [Kitasatospora aureofaciens]MBV6695528.1 hypothetical protein [Kitasatospora aureofaciens]
MRLHIPADTGWEHPSVTVAAYDTPTGAIRWRARFEDTVPEEVVGALLCAVAHDFAQPDRYDQQRALRGPAITEPGDILDNIACPGAVTGGCSCPSTFDLDLSTSARHPQWRLRGWDAAGRRWRAWFDQATPAHLIAAACHPLTRRICAYLPAAADAYIDEPGGDSTGAVPEAATPDPQPVIGPEGAPFETVLDVAREVVQQTGRIGPRAIATGVRARGFAIGSKRAQRIAEILKAERAAGLL